MKKIDQPLKMTGVCEIQCAAADPGQPEKNPSFDITAYNGGIMSVNNYGPVVIDLDGMAVSDVTPVMFNHETYSLNSLLGQTLKVEKANTLKATGEIMNDSETAKRVVGLAKRGFKFQASVGASPIEAKEIAEGVSAEVNGQTLMGPFTLVTKSRLKEISIVPLGADETTNAAITAAKHEGEGNMSTENMDKSAEAIRAAAVAEETRIAKVKAATKDHDTIRASAINEGWSVDKTETAVKDAELKAAREELAAIKAKAKADEDAKDRPKGPGIKINGQTPTDLRVIEAAACLRSGIKSPEKAYDSETLNKASDMKVRSFTDVVRAALALDGKQLECTRHDTREFLQAAFSTRSIANILSNVANKFIMQGFGAVEATWREIANVRSVVDFKANTGVRLIMSNLLQSLAPNGEIQHGELSDETRSIQADTKALMLGISRKDIINDDLSAMTELPQKLGFAAARTFNTDFWTAFEAAVAANFSASAPKSNQTTGALSLTTLAAAETLFLGLKDADGNPIGAKASKLLCGTGAFTKAREIFASTALVGGSAKDVASNIYVNMFTPVFSSYLSAAPWYLTADPMAIPVMEAAFLNGQQEPIVETADADFNTLGVQMRCYYDYGVAFGEWRGAVRSTGV